MNIDVATQVKSRPLLWLSQILWDAPSEYGKKIQLAFNLASAGGQGTMTEYGLALNEMVNRHNT
jgi:hypothetical protein